MYRRYPDDLRPSRLAEVMAHAGTALEIAVPVVLGLSRGGWSLVLGLVLMMMLHGFITSTEEPFAAHCEPQFEPLRL